MATEPLGARADAPGRGRLPETRLARLLLLGAAAWSAWIFARGWGRWPDVLIDFGRELYLPWRLVEGEVLYRDLAHLNGPLSPSWNALWFRLAGPGIWTLVWVNLLLWVALLGLLHRRLEAATSTLGAAAGVAFALVAFAFGQQAFAGNYNYLAPYAHEATHGLLLGLAALAAGARLDRGSGRALLAGVFLGLAFLTKPEPFAAAAVALALRVLLAPRGARARAAAAIAAGALLPVLVAFLLLLRLLPAGEALAGALGGWAHVLDREVAGLPFYRGLLGVDDAGRNAGRLVAALGWLAVALVPLVAYARRVERAGTPGGVGRPALVCALVAGFWSWMPEPTGAPLYWLARGLPGSLLLVLLFALRARARCADPARRRAWGELVVLAAFGAVLLAKIVLNVRFAHYGVFLALPGATLLVAFLVGPFAGPALGPQAGSGAGRACLVAGVLGLVAAAGLDSWRRSDAYFVRKTHAIGEGRDFLRTDEVRGRAVAAALARVEAELGPDEELLVLPEGVTLNYLARRRTPTRVLNFMPLELVVFGEASILADLERSPPAAVLLVHKDTTEYGFPFFGRDYGLGIARWVSERYRRVWVESLGGDPLQPGTVFGIELLRPRP